MPPLGSAIVDEYIPTILSIYLSQIRIEIVNPASFLKSTPYIQPSTTNLFKSTPEVNPY